MSKVRIKNTSNFVISIILNNVRYRRDLNPGQETVLPEDAFEEFNFDTGCRSYVKNGYLKVIADDPVVKESVVEGPRDVDIDVNDLLTNKSVNDLAVALKNGSASFYDKVATAAIKLSISDAARCSLIKHYCGIDVLNAIALQRSTMNK